MLQTLQKSYQQSPQIIITLPLLEGLDGVQKMSKSLNNTIALQDPPNEFLGKVMSLSDTMMWRYYRLLSEHPLTFIEAAEKDCQGSANPRDYKLQLAHELVSRYHGSNAADQAQLAFISRFSSGIIPEDLPHLELSTTHHDLPLANVLKNAQLVSSTSEALRLIKQGAVKIAQDTVKDNQRIKPGADFVLYQVGKRRAAYIKLSQQ